MELLRLAVVVEEARTTALAWTVEMGVVAHTAAQWEAMELRDSTDLAEMLLPRRIESLVAAAVVEQMAGKTLAA
jgi:hypothetical protein